MEDIKQKQAEAEKHGADLYEELKHERDEMLKARNAK